MYTYYKFRFISRNGPSIVSAEDDNIIVKICIYEYTQ